MTLLHSGSLQSRESKHGHRDSPDLCVQSAPQASLHFQSTLHLSMQEGGVGVRGERRREEKERREEEGREGKRRGEEWGGRERGEGDRLEFS